MRAYILALCLCAPVAAMAADPVPIQYGLHHQGRLLGEGDVPVDGVRNLTFKLYRAATGGEPVWTQIANVDVAAGYYQLVLGDGTSLDATPLTEDIFEGPLYLAITVFPGPELFPRLAVGMTPYAVRATVAERMDGGIITNTVIQGGSIEDAKLTGVAITGGSLEGVEVSAGQIHADKLFINGEAVDPNGVKRSGDTMTGPLTAPSFNATTTSGQPLTVKSGTRVDNLNAHKLDGHAVADFHLKSDFSIDDLARKDELAAADFTNLLNNGGMENWRQGLATNPSWWERTGTWNSLQAKFSRTVGRDGPYALHFVDSDTASRVSLVQSVYAAGSAALADVPFTVSVWYRRTTGTAPGEICLHDSPLSQTCEQLDGTGGLWKRAVVTHRTTASPQYLQVTLAAASSSAQTAEYDFDAVMLVRGDVGSHFRASPVDFVPSGMISFFPGTCPYGYSEYVAARGRTIVATPLAGETNGLHGAALTDKGPRNITEVPIHTHDVDPPDTLSSDVGNHVHNVDPPLTASTNAGAHAHTVDPPALQSAINGAHRHFVDPPAVNSSSAGDHEHGIATFQDDYSEFGGATPSWADDAGSYGVRAFTERAGSHVHSFDFPGVYSDTIGDHSHNVDIPPFVSATEAAHTHTVDVVPFDSANAGAHNHRTDIARFTSMPTGLNVVDVAMPYIQLTACQAL